MKPLEPSKPRRTIDAGGRQAISIEMLALIEAFYDARGPVQEAGRRARRREVQGAAAYVRAFNREARKRQV